MSTLSWRPIAELPDKPVGDIVLSNGQDVMGLFSGVTRDKHGTTWFIDAALYDGDEDPLWFFVLPPVPEETEETEETEMKFNCSKHGAIDYVLVDGYLFGDRLLEGVMFQVRANDDQTYEVSIDLGSASYFNQLNTKMWLERAKKFVEKHDFGRCSYPGCREDVDLQPWHADL